MKLFVLASLLLLGFDITAQKVVSITFDDLPYHTNYGISVDEKEKRTKLILTAAREYNAPLIGFVNEYKVYHNGSVDSAFVQMLELWLKDGHSLGNHAFSHMDYNRRDSVAFAEDVKRGALVTAPLCARYAKSYGYFRHPYLHRGDTKEKVEFLARFLRSNGYVEAPVTLDNGEWIFAAAYDSLLKSDRHQALAPLAKEYVNYLRAKLKFYERNSDELFGRKISHVMLLHANNINAFHFAEVLRMFRDEGYNFVTLDKALEDPAYKSRDEYVGRGGISWLHRWAITLKKPREFYRDEPSVPEHVLKLARVAGE
jgi:peptidoglycan/xylan/chitin deacetylase (PgdA/CDA1 family)